MTFDTAAAGRGSLEPSALVDAFRDEGRQPTLFIDAHCYFSTDAFFLFTACRGVRIKSRTPLWLATSARRV